MSDKDGGQAFPGEDHPDRTTGMSLRDWFAGQALVGLVSGITSFREDIPGIIVNRPTDCSELAYTYADAMLAARDANSEGKMDGER